MVQASPKPPTPAAASDGPWFACATSYRSGAVYLDDAHGDLIGWATDRAGHTTENVPPDRRSRAETLRNGHRMAMAPQMLDALKALVAELPFINTLLDDAPAHPSFRLLSALHTAKALLAIDAAHAVLAEQMVNAPAVSEGAAS